MELCIVALGYSIGYTTGDPTRFIEDIQVLKPHFVSLVPRVLNRIYQSVIVAADAPGLKGAMFRKAVADKLHNLRANGQHTHALWDRLVFRKVNAVLGGRLTKIGCGSAPFSREVAEFLKIATLADIAEGYGMTETCGCCSTAWPFDAQGGGTVGSLVPTAEVKLVDVPDLGYRVTDKPFPRGELLFRGANRFIAYYKGASLVSAYLLQALTSTRVRTQTRQKRRRRSTRTGGCTRATSRPSTRAGGSRSSTG